MVKGKKSHSLPTSLGTLDGLEAGKSRISRTGLPQYTVAAKDLSKSYREGEKELEVLKGIDLEIENGEIVAVVGPSGAGKSTLLHLIGLMDASSSGHLNILGWDVNHLQETDKDVLRNKYIGFLFQFHYLLPELTILENAALPLRIAGLKSLESSARAEELLRSVGLEERLHHLPSQVSGGEQQRAALARAMVSRPALLICDEPTGNLDLERGEEIRNLIWRVARAQHATVLVATHNPDIAKSADRILKIVDGQVVS